MSPNQIQMNKRKLKQQFGTNTNCLHNRYQKILKFIQKLSRSPFLYGSIQNKEQHIIQYHIRYIHI